MTETNTQLVQVRRSLSNRRTYTFLDYNEAIDFAVARARLTKKRQRLYLARLDGVVISPSIYLVAQYKRLRVVEP